MSKLVFQSVGVANVPYRGFISEVRTWFQRIASWAEKNGPESAAAMLIQLGTLVSALGGNITAIGGTVAVRNSAGADSHVGTMVSAGNVNLPATATILDHAETTLIGDLAGTTSTATFSVTSGAIAGAAIPGTDKIIKSTVKFPLGTVTGTPVTGWVAACTIVNGVVTATTFTAS